LLNNDKTVTISIKSGTKKFKIDDTFAFDTSFNYDEYRGSLAEPDCMKIQVPFPTYQGRSAIVLNEYVFAIE
jgi:hypothetical protein